MKIYLLTDNKIGPAKCLFAKAELTIAAQKMGWSIVADIEASELTIVIGRETLLEAIPTNKLVFVAKLEDILGHAELFLLEAKSKAEPYQKNNMPKASGVNRPKKIVAITACPTGVAHTFMAAEAIENEAKKRGWDCKVETRGSVGAKNVLTADDIASADIVFVAVDIDVDLAKFTGKKMYRTSTGLALKKTSHEFDKAIENAQFYHPQSANQVIHSTKKQGGYIAIC